MTQTPFTPDSDGFEPKQGGEADIGPTVGCGGPEAQKEMLPGKQLAPKALVGTAKRERAHTVKSLSLAKCVGQRLRVCHMSEGRLSVHLGSEGMVCLGIGSHEGMPPILVLYDEGVSPSCIRVEMTLKELLPFFASAWLGLFEVPASNVVVRTRDGYWDLAFVSWSHDGRVRSFSLVPMKWIECRSRSEEAFAKAFGDQARRAHHIMFRMRAAKLGSIGT